MPILLAEPSVYPDDLFKTPAVSAGAEWRVLHTKPRQEKGLARDLLARDIPYFLPTSRRRHDSGGRIRFAQLPLFDGYLFVLADRDQYLAALDTRRVVRSLAVPDQLRLRGDLNRLHQLLECDASVTRELNLLPGQLVEITDGPLVGLRGTVIRSATGDRFVVSVDFIRQGASVLCDSYSLQPVDSMV